jgi:hypothetical protein
MVDRNTSLYFYVSLYCEGVIRAWFLLIGHFTTQTLLSSHFCGNFAHAQRMTKCTAHCVGAIELTLIDDLCDG